MSQRQRFIVLGTILGIAAMAVTFAGRPLGGPAALAAQDGAAPTAPSVAFVHVGAALALLIDAPESAAASEALAAELSTKDQDYIRRLEDLGKALQAQPPGSPQGQALYEEGSQLAQEHAEWREEALARRGKLDADRIEAAYRKIVTAVRTVAARRGVDVVQPFVPTDQPFEAEDPDRAMLAIRLRTAIVSPPALDITPEVMKELGLGE